ncbi:MAG: hypothetical protein ABFD58_08570 [Anaerolineaceae bacterium]
MNDDNSSANLSDARKDILECIDAGSRKTFNKSFQELQELSDKLGVPISNDCAFALSVIGALELRKSASKAAE